VKNLPRVIAEREIFKSRICTIKEIDVEFDKNEKAMYHIVEKDDSVMVVPITKDGKVILIKEWAAALDAEQIFLPKGVAEGRTLKEAANKELQEEIGLKARKLVHLTTLQASPSITRHKTHVFLACDLIPSKLKGDEKHKIEQLPVTFDKANQMVMKREITEARVIASLYLTKSYLEKSKNTKTTRTS
jgi:ADP-ribose diphosphatase